MIIISGKGPASEAGEAPEKHSVMARKSFKKRGQLCESGWVVPWDTAEKWKDLQNPFNTDGNYLIFKEFGRKIL